MARISATGLIVTVTASVSFPVPVTLSEFADDADPFDFDNLVIGETAMALNGTLVGWSVANPINPTLNVVPGSEEDQFLGLLLELNRVGRGKSVAGDVITMTAQYPGDELPIILTGGQIISGSPASSAASSGRIKSKAFGFSFENRVGV